MNLRSAASLCVPWACVPVLLLFNIRYEGFEYGNFDLTLLQIPAAVALTYRYGRNGFVAALIGCAPLLIDLWLMDSLTIGAQAALYAIAVHAAWLTLTNRWLGPEKSTPPHAVSMALLLAVGSIAFTLPPINFAISNWWGIPILYYAFFVLGLRDAQIRKWLVIAGLITFVGVVLKMAVHDEKLMNGLNYEAFMEREINYRSPFGVFHYMIYIINGWIELTRLREVWDTLGKFLPQEQEWIKLFHVRLVLDTLGEFLTLLLFFWTGRWLRAIARATAPPSADTLTYGVKLALGAGILFLAGPLWHGLVATFAGEWIFKHAFTDYLRILSPGDSYYILPLVTLSLALTRRNGMLIAAVLVGTYYALSGVANWSTGRDFNINFADLAIVIAFAIFGARIATRLPAAKSMRAASWLPTPLPAPQSSIELDEWKRQHDEISLTVRRVMLALLVYALFCGLTLAASEDASIYGDVKVTLPIANSKIDYTTFLIAGPLILVGLTVYLHLFLKSAFELGRPRGASPLPYIFNMDNPLAVALSSFMHYWLPVLLMFQFAIKAGNIWAGFWLGLATTGMGIVMVCLRMKRISIEHGRNPRWFAHVIVFILGFLFVFQMTYGDSLLKRPLVLDQAELSNKYLEGVEFRWASLKEVNFKGAILRGAELRGADLRGANLQDADLRGANLQDADLQGADLRGADLQDAGLKDAELRGALGITCESLRRAENWRDARRDPDLSC